MFLPGDSICLIRDFFLFFLHYFKKYSFKLKKYLYFCGKKIIVKLKFMNAFEMEFINDMKRLSFRRYDVCDILGVTMPTLKSKLQNPDTITVGEVVKLKRKGFKLMNLGIYLGI